MTNTADDAVYYEVRAEECLCLAKKLLTEAEYYRHKAMWCVVHGDRYERPA